MAFSGKTPGPGVLGLARAFLAALRDFRQTAITSSSELRLRRVRYSREALLTMKTMVVLEENLDTILIGKFQFESDLQIRLGSLPYLHLGLRKNIEKMIYRSYRIEKYRKIIEFSIYRNFRYDTISYRKFSIR